MELDFITKRSFPDFFKYNSPKLLKLFDYYLEFLHKDTYPGQEISDILSNNDLDTATDDFLLMHKIELMADYPNYVSSDLKVLMKKILMLYNAKGSVQSIETFFRTLYNDNVTLSYPKEYILRTSDGKWVQPTYIKPTGFLTSVEMSKYINYRISGKTSGAYGYIETVIPFIFSKAASDAFLVLDVQGNFIDGEEATLILERFDTDPEIVDIDIDKAELGEGYFANTDGWLSSDKVIQDSGYYQDFSYVISSTIPISEYRDILKKLIHPAGFALFGNLEIYTDKDITEVFKTEVIRVWLIEWYNIMQLSLDFLPGFSLKNKLQYTALTKETVDYLMLKDICPFRLYKDMTVAELAKTSNRSCLIALYADSGALVNPEDITLNDEITIKNANNESSILTINLTGAAEYRKSSVKSNKIALQQEDLSATALPVIFVDNKKLRNTQITKTSDGYTVNIPDSDNVTVFQTEKSIVRHYEYLIDDKFQQFNLSKFTSKYHVVPFVDGACYWKYMTFNNGKASFARELPIGKYIEFVILATNQTNILNTSLMNGSVPSPINNIKQNNFMY